MLKTLPTIACHLNTHLHTLWHYHQHSNTHQLTLWQLLLNVSLNKINKIVAFLDFLKTEKIASIKHKNQCEWSYELHSYTMLPHITYGVRDRMPDRKLYVQITKESASQLSITVISQWHALLVVRVVMQHTAELSSVLEVTANVSHTCLATLSEYQVQILVILWLFIFRLWAIGPTRLRLIMWPCDPDLGLWLMRVVVLHPYIKFEVRRPWHSEDMVHDVCQH